MLLKKFAKAYNMANSSEDKFEVLLKILELDPSLGELFGLDVDDMELWDIYDIYDYMEENGATLEKLFRR